MIENIFKRGNEIGFFACIETISKIILEGCKPLENISFTEMLLPCSIWLLEIIHFLKDRQ